MRGLNFLVYKTIISMKIKLKLLNDLGSFDSDVMEITEAQYLGLIEVSKNFYTEGGYEMYLESGFMVVPPDVVKKSILIIEVIETDQ